MELQEYKKRAHEYTAKASEIARQLNFAGIGIIWIIRTANGELKLSHLILFIPLLLISLSLLCDFIQYLLGGFLWIRFYKQKEKEGFAETENIKTSAWRSSILYIVYFLKHILMVAAYIFIIKALFSFF